MRTMRGPIFLGTVVKLHKSIDEQIELLKSRGLIINDLNLAKFALTNINYYRLSGYLFEFKNPDDTYLPGITFERILNLYTFDCKLTRILMYALENVEESLKTRFSYALSSTHPSDPLNYLNPCIYKDRSDFKQFENLFNKSKADNSNLPFVKHHNKTYSGDLPIWVAVEIMTMGNIHKLYNNLITSLQKVIAKEYKTGPVQLKSWIENLTYTRNHLAHYMRIYDYSFGRIPVSCINHIPITQSGKIFDQIMAIGFMFTDKKEWISYVIPEIAKLITEYKNDICLTDIGFPNDWEDTLLSC